MDKIELIPLKNPIEKEVIIPGSKSYTNRALVMAALGDGKSKITGFSESEDSKVLIEALKKVGIKIEQKEKEILVYGNNGQFKKVKLELDMGPAGTSTRFFTSVAALIPGEIVIDGSKRLRQRPIGELVEALKELGVDIEYLGKKGCPPLKIKGGNIKGGKVSMDGSFSSQYFTSLMQIAPVLEKGIEIEVRNDQKSKSYIDMTIGALKSFGVEAENDNYKNYKIFPSQNYVSTFYRVEGDASGCSYLWGIAAISQSKIKVHNINQNSTQADVHFADIMAEMGCEVNKNAQENWIEVKGVKNLRAIQKDMELMPDTAQTLAVVASFAEGKTRITGLSTLKIKETDRLKATKVELSKMGIKVEIGDDFMEIEGGKPKGAVIETYKDHRMAMSFAQAGSRIEDMIIENPNVVSKSFPNFWEVLRNLGIKVKNIN